MPDSRYPYTYAADFLRAKVENPTYIGNDVTINTPAISRSQASTIISTIADAIGQTKLEISTKLADAFLNEIAKTTAAFE